MFNFNLAHLHLLLNHVPTVGTTIALALLVLSLIRKNDGLLRAGLEVLAMVALLTLPAYLTGLGTQTFGNLNAAEELMTRHHDAAVVGSIGMLLTGWAAWLALWQFRRAGRPSNVLMGAVIVFSAITVALMARAATLGGEIRHEEIVLADAPPAAPAWITAASLASVVNDNVWVWPAMEVLHFVGLWVLFGVVLVVHLRMLGMMKQVPFSALHRLLPWAVIALFVNILTGMMWVLATPQQYLSNISFLYKVILLLLAGADLLYMTAFEGPWHVRAGDSAPVRVKFAALSAIVLWGGVMYYGRMLPFLGNAF